MKQINPRVAGMEDRAWPRHVDTRSMQGQEVLAMRGACSKTFALGRGMYQAVLYPEDVHYQEADGSWAEIDNRIRPAQQGEAGGLESGAGPLRAWLADTARAADLVRLSDSSGREITWQLEGAADSPGIRESKAHAADLDEDARRGRMEKIGYTVRYSDVMPHTDLLCRLHGKHFKDELVLRSIDAPHSFSFLMDVQGLEPRPQPDGALTLWDAEQPGSPAFTFPPSFLYDANGQRGEVETHYESTENGLRMALAADEAFLQTAQYPVVLDPLVKVGSDGSLSDTYVCSGKPTENFRAANPLCVGPVDGESRTYLKCTELPKLDASHTVAKAWMQLVAYPTNDGREEDSVVYAHEVLANWNPNSLNWNNQPAHGQDHLDYAIAPKWNTNGQGMSFDITNLVRKWYTGKNYGVMLDAHGTHPVKLVSSEYSYDKNLHPVLQINYMSHAGLESYLAYESYSAGRAGTAHVALHSGNLVFTRGLTAMNGNRMPVSLGLVYNACDNEKDWYGLGGGWRLNWGQHVHRETISGVLYYLYTDEDGTSHAFKKELSEETTYFEDEEGLSLKLYEVGDTVEIVSKGDSKLIFGKPTQDFTPENMHIQMIRSAQDAQGNKATFTFDGRKLTKAIDGAGRITELAYTSANVSITVPGYTRKVMVHIDASGVQSVDDLDRTATENHTGYGYYQGFLNSVYNPNNSTGLAIYYHLSDIYQLRRVRQVTEFGAGSARGNSREYEFSDCVTRVTDLTVPDGKTLTYQFNDYGNVVGVQDELGYAAFARFTDIGTPNTPEAVSKLQRLVLNKLEGHNFESPGSWATGNESGGASFVYDDTERLAGRKSLKINKHDVRGVAFAMHEAKVEPGVYTFSSFLKSTGDIWAWVEMSYMDANGVRQTHASQKVRQMGEFTRLSCTATLPANAVSKKLTCRVMAGDAQGTAWFDCAQLETGTIANRYNMLYYGDFSAMKAGTPTGWTQYYGESSDARITAADPGAPGFLGSNCLRLTGTPDAKLRLVQYIEAAGKAGDNYVIGGWSKGLSSPIRRPDQETIDKMTPEEKDRLRYYALQVEFHPIGADAEDYRHGGQADFNEEWVGWQYACAAIVAPKDYDCIRVSIRYENNLNHAQIGAVSLVKELYGQTYAFDENNNVTSVLTLADAKSKMEYDKFDNLTSYIQPGRSADAKYTLTYGSTDAEKKKHLPRTTLTPTGILSERTYDAHGNNLQVKTSSKTRPGSFLMCKTAYSADGNYAVASTDARGKTVTTDIDPDKGLVRSVTDPAGQSATFAYDTASRMTEAKAIADGKIYRNTYAYDQDRLTTITHNTTADAAGDVNYGFAYDALGNPTTVKVGDQALSTNVYSDTGDKLLQRVEYGNGGDVRYAYDAFKRTTGISYDGESDPKFVYEYGANGMVGSVKEIDYSAAPRTKRENRVSYDTAERPVTAEVLEWDQRTYHLLQRYDKYNQPSKLSEEVAQPGLLRGLYETECAYDVEGKPTSLTYRSAQTKDPELIRMGQLKYVPAESQEKGVLHLKAPDDPQEVFAEYTIPAPPTRNSPRPRRSASWSMNMTSWAARSGVSCTRTRRAAAAQTYCGHGTTMRMAGMAAAARPGWYICWSRATGRPPTPMTRWATSRKKRRMGVALSRRGWPSKPGTTSSCRWYSRAGSCRYPWNWTSAATPTTRWGS